MTIDGETIDTTVNHPFFVEGGMYVSAGELKPGDRIMLLNGEFRSIESTEHEILDVPVKVYNFEVEELHNYYVGTQGILVHNKCASGNAGGKLTKTSYGKSSGKQKTGPKPQGTGAHNLKIEEIASQITDGEVIAGGGRICDNPEAIWQTPNGLKKTRRPDILVKKADGSLYGINVGKTTAKGAPIKREVEALYDLEDHGLPMYFVGYDK